jgi:hypothetical protein
VSERNCAGASDTKICQFIDFFVDRLIRLWAWDCVVKSSSYKLATTHNAKHNFRSEGAIAGTPL